MHDDEVKIYCHFLEICNCVLTGHLPVPNEQVFVHVVLIT